MTLAGAVPAFGDNVLAFPPGTFLDLFQEPEAPQCHAQWVWRWERGRGYLFHVVPLAWPPEAQPQSIRAVSTELVTAISTPHGREWVPMEMPTVLSAGDVVALRFVVPEDSVFMMVGFDW